MEFSGQYLTYEEYRGLCGTLDLMSFNLLEYEARKQIDLRTQNRLKNVSIIPQDVKLCVFNLINKIESYAKSTETASSNKASESIDGYSVSYITASQIKDIIASKNVEIQDDITHYLYGTIVNNEHLIYAGVE